MRFYENLTWKKIYAFIFLILFALSAIVYSKPVINCLVSCNQLFISFDSSTYTVEGMGYLNCNSGSQFCEFYTLLSIWCEDNNGQLVYLQGFCSGGALRCGTINYPILTSPIILSPGLKYVISFSVYDVNMGCGTCGNPIICNATCRTYKVIDLR